LSGEITISLVNCTHRACDTEFGRYFLKILKLSNVVQLEAGMSGISDKVKC